MRAALWVAGAAEREVRAEARKHGDVETGGVLLGYWVRGAVVVTAALGPGPGAQRTRTSFRPDAAWQRQSIATAYAASGRTHTYLGDWHTHPGGTSTLSRTDRRTLAAIDNYAPARASRAVLAVLGPTPTERSSPGSTPAGSAVRRCSTSARTRTAEPSPRPTSRDWTGGT